MLLQRSNEDLNRLFNITEVLTQCIRYQQMYIYMCTILAYLRDSLTYMRQVAIHTMDYVDAATTNILSPDILPVDDLRNMLRHIESELSFNNAPTYFIQMTPFISTGISTDTCIDSRRTVPASHWCVHTKQSTTASNIWSCQFTSSI